MPTLPTPYSAVGDIGRPGLFGGNILAPRTPMEGAGSYGEAIDALGVTTLRYPGGALTEYYFDLANPDAAIATHAVTGEVTDFMPLSDIMAYSADTGRAVSIVIPTRDQLSATRVDDNGDRLPDVDEAVLRGFVRDLVEGDYGNGTVSALEIGNEYWGSGQMSAAEYGRLAAEMTEILDDELGRLADGDPAAAKIEIIVQMGTNFGASSLNEAYAGMSPEDITADLEARFGIELDPGAVRANGNVDWTEVNNEIVLEQLRDADVLDRVDGVAAHIYSRAPELEHTRYFMLDQIEDTWLEENPEFEIHVTEWNQRSNTQAFEAEEDYGLFQAQEILQMVEEYMRAGVEEAQVWPLIQNSPASLSFGRAYSDSSPPGEMFNMLSDNLPGMRMLDFSDGERGTEWEGRAIDVHAFADGDDLLLYLTSNSRTDVSQTEVDLSNLVEATGEVEISVLGVAQGAAPGDSRSAPVIDTPDADDLYVDGLLEAVLAPGEIMQVRLNDIRPTEAFRPIFEASGMEDAGPQAAVRQAAVVDEDADEDEEEDETETEAREAPEEAPQRAAPSRPDPADPPDPQPSGADLFNSLMRPEGAPEEDPPSDHDSDDEDAPDDLGFGWLIGLLPLLGLLGLGG